MGRTLLLLLANSALLIPVTSLELTEGKGQPWRSKGCDNYPSGDFANQLDVVRAEGKGYIFIDVHEDLGPVNRKFFVSMPPDVGPPPDAVPLVVQLHGQTSQGHIEAVIHHLDALGAEQKFITVYPQGMDDILPGELDQGTAWNDGDAGDPGICDHQDVIRRGTRACYASCRARNKCGPCNWATCHDDVLFIGSVIEAMAAHNCIDLSRLYLLGSSAGGTMTHFLLQQFPGVFAAAAPWFGLPFTGRGMPTNLKQEELSSLRQTAILSLHSRQDECIPVTGGMGNEGRTYESLASQQAIWANIHGCNSKATVIKTEWDGGSANIRCSEYKSCSSGRRVITCLYDGAHAEFPSELDDLMMWFFLQFSLDHKQVTKRGSQACFADKAFCRVVSALDISSRVEHHRHEVHQAA